MKNEKKKYIKALANREKNCICNAVMTSKSSKIMFDVPLKYWIVKNVILQKKFKTYSTFKNMSKMWQKYCRYVCEISLTFGSQKSNGLRSCWKKILSSCKFIHKVYSKIFVGRTIKNTIWLQNKIVFRFSHAHCQKLVASCVSTTFISIKSNLGHFHCANEKKIAVNISFFNHIEFGSWL